MATLWRWIVLNWAELLILFAICGGIIKSINLLLKFKIDLTDRLSSIEQCVRGLTKYNDVRKDDYVVIFKGLHACLDGLHQQGANGPVTQARDDLQELLFERAGQKGGV